VVHLPRGIGPKITLGLVAFVVLVGVAMSAVLLWGFGRTQDNATTRSQEGLELYGERTLQSFAQQVAQLTSGVVAQASADAQQTANMMTDLERNGATIPWDNSKLVLGPDGQTVDPSLERVSDVWVPPGVSSDSAAADLETSSVLDGIYPALKARGNETLAMYFIGPSGAMRYFPSGTLGGLGPTFAPLSLPTFLNAMQPANPGKTPVWTGEHLNFADRGLVQSVSVPVYDGERFLGVLAIDVSQQSYIDAIDGNKPAGVDFAFAVDASGKLLGTASAPTLQGELDHGNADVASAIQKMKSGGTGVERVVFGGTPYLMSYAPVAGVGGSIALASPVAAVTAAADAASIRDSINHQGNQTLALTLMTMAGLLVLALVGTAYLNRKLLLRPIAGLVAGTRAVAGGDLNASIVAHSNDELGDLAGSFNEMTTMLRRREQALQDEIQERKRTQTELSALFAAMNDLVFVIDREGRFISAAPTGADSARKPERMVGTTVRDHFSVDVAERLLAVIRQALESGKTQSIEYHFPEGEGGKDRWLAGAASPLSEDTVLWVARDVSDMVENRQLLEVRVAEQRQQLSTLLEMSQSVISTLELQPLVDLILSQLAEAVPCNGISLLVQRDDELLLLDSGQPLPASAARPEKPLLVFRRDNTNAIWPMLDTRQPVVIGNIRGDEPLGVAFRELQGQDMNVFGHVTSLLSVPLYTQGHAFGAIALARPEANAFTARDSELAMAFASQAALAFQNADLLAQAERRARENEALSRIASSLTFDRPMEATLDAVAGIIVEATNALACGVVVLDPRAGRVRLAGGYGLEAGYVEAVEEAWRNGAGTLSTDAMETGLSSVVLDGRTRMLDDPAYAPIHPFIQNVKWEPVVVLPLRYQGQPVGALNVCYAAGAEPAANELAFLHTIADQAALAVENVSLYKEAERRARENEALSRIASALTFDQPLELTFETLAERVVQATDAMAVGVVLWDAARHVPHMAGAFGLPDSYAEDIDEAWRRGARGATLDALESGEMQIFGDGREAILDNAAYGPVQRHWQDAPWETVALMPMAYHGEVVGALSCYYPRGIEPGADELSLLTAVADQAAIAVENARLFSHNTSRVGELEAVAKIASNFTFQQSLESMMDAVAAQVAQATGSLSCSVVLADPDTLRPYRVAGNFGAPAGYREALESAWRTGSESVTAEVLRARQSRTISNAQETVLGRPGYEQAQQLAKDAHWDTLALVPMIYQDRAVGLLIVGYAAEREPTGDQMAFIEAIADQAAVAAENARLFAQAQSLAVVEERQRLSRELHDSVSQALYGISLGAQTASEILAGGRPEQAREPVEYVLSLAEAGIAEMRALIFELRPEALATEGLLGALKKQAASMRARHGIAVDAELGNEPALPLDAKEVLYRIAQEALHNIVKHANASRVRLVLAVKGSNVVLEIADNGKGFEVADNYPGHLGLKSMEERARQLGGQVSIDSAPGAGVTVRVTLPIHAQA
jgi:PAS domain S-box-containing protein